MKDVTRILSEIEHGNARAAEQLLPLVYGELRKLAAARLANEKPGQTLQATALVHDAYIRLVDTDQAQQWNSRGHFFAAAAEAMRRILVENARSKATVKKGGQMARREVEECSTAAARQFDEVIDVHEALDNLAREDKSAAELVKLHYFGGFSLEESGELLGMSRATAYRTWTFARAWLRALLLDRESRTNHHG